MLGPECVDYDVCVVVLESMLGPEPPQLRQHIVVLKYMWYPECVDYDVCVVVPELVEDL